MSSVKICRRCQTESPDIFLYCFNCGHSLADALAPGEDRPSFFFPAAGAMAVLGSSFYAWLQQRSGEALPVWQEGKPFVLILVGFFLIAAPGNKSGLVGILLLLAVFLL